MREASSGVTVDPRAVITETVGDLSLQFLAGDFFQNNPFLLPRLVAHVADEAAAGGARFLVDAYCGSGLLGLAAAPRFERVLGVEVSESAVKWARANAARNARANCDFIAADASTVFAAVPFAAADTAVIVDPPRKGCGDDFLRQLVAFAPRTIVYVSCNPETQVRDIAVLRAAGYTCARALPFDMFPQTRHVEVGRDARRERLRRPGRARVGPPARRPRPRRRQRLAGGRAFTLLRFRVGGVVAAFVDAADARAGLAHLLHDELGAALRARLRHRASHATKSHLVFA